MTKFAQRFSLLMVLIPAVNTDLAAQDRVLAPVFPMLVESLNGTTASGGMSVEIVLEAGRRAGRSVSIEIVPWARALATASAIKDLLIFPLARTPEREALFEWLGPVNRIDYHFFRLKTGPAPTIRSIDQVGNRTVGALRADVVNTYLRSHSPQMAVIDAPQLESLVAQLVGGRVDYIVTTGHAVKEELKLLHHELGDVEELFPFEDFSSDPFSYLALAKGSNPIVAEAWRTALSSMRADGTWEAIFKKHQ